MTWWEGKGSKNWKDPEIISYQHPVKQFVGWGWGESQWNRSVFMRIRMRPNSHGYGLVD